MIETIESICGSKEILENSINDLNEDGKREYRTNDEKDNEMKKILGIDESNVNNEVTGFDVLDARLRYCYEKIRS